MDISGQSGAGMLDLFASRPQVREWLVTWVGVNRPRTFSSVQAFDGYVREARRLGALVTFTTPFSCQAEIPA